MIELDGAVGEGGGQILRTAPSLSLVAGTPFRMTGIRAGRRKPGLMRQHLAAVRAAATVGRAQLEGAELGSSEIVFVPETVHAGSYRFDTGTAGSAALVFQAVLPALMLADWPSRPILSGGTHNPCAPPFEFLETAFLPQLHCMGPRVAVRGTAWLLPAEAGSPPKSIRPRN